MYQGVMKKFQDKVRNRQYVMTVHAEEEMSDDLLTIFDVEQGVLTGEIVERQRDVERKEWKYLIQGRSLDDRRVALTVKLSVTGKMVIITVYAE